MSVSLPTTMPAVEISRPGGPDVLRLAERPLPQPGEQEVLIAVAAAGVNRPDCFQRAGLYPPPPGASDLPGLEVAGTVVRTGPGVSRWKEGDQVCALTPGGGYAAYCVAPAGHCLPVPRGLTLTEAACLPETTFTVWINVFERGRLSPGETLLIQGGSSGIGVTAIQMAKSLGHRVFVTAGSAEKCAACVQLGADRAIHYKAEDFVEVVKSLTQGKGVDVILDMVGGSYIPRELRCLADDGRLSIIAFLGGSRAEVDFNDVLRRRLTITGSTLRPRTIAFKSGIAATLEQRIWPLIEAGRIRPVIHSRFPAAQAAQAHTLMESSSHVGKIVLEF